MRSDVRRTMQPLKSIFTAKVKSSKNLYSFKIKIVPLNQNRQWFFFFKSLPIGVFMLCKLKF